MSETAFQLVKATGVVLALMVAVALQHQRPHARVAGSWRVNGMLWGTNAVTMGVVCGACACAVSLWAQARGFGLLNLVDAPVWAATAVSVLALDLLAYGWHRANHRIPLLWRFHQIHHSDPAFTATTALRFHPGELLLSLPLRLALVALVGVPVAAILVFEIFFAFMNFLEHADLDLPIPFERRLSQVLVTPALHRRHHSQRRIELDSNFGTIFTFWDRSLRTFGASDSSVRIATGLPGASGASLGALLLQPGRAISWGAEE